MKVIVTQEDIDNGEQCGYTTCPISLALKRNGLTNFGVGAERVFGPIPGETEIDFHAALHGPSISELPIVAKQFIERFDDGTFPVEPFEFEIEVLT